MFLAGKLKRIKFLAAAFLMMAATAITAINLPEASAYGLILNRKITMSSSADGSIADGQGVTYEVEFDVATDAEDISGVVIDFCTDSPIIEDGCTGLDTNGFDTNHDTTAALNLVAGLTDFTLDTTNSTVSQIVLIEGVSGAYNPGASETITFEISGIDNPENVNTTFYARILTFDSTAGAQGYTDTDIDAGDANSDIDAGGIALSTAEQIIVTSRVQEQLDFCVYLVASVQGDRSCTGVSGSNIILGDDNGTLSVSGPFVNKEAMYSVATNASNGVTIRMTGTTLVSGAFDITATGASPGAQSNPGNEQFGICTYRDTGGGNTGLTPVDGYDGDGAGGIDVTACTGTTDTAGTATPGGDNSAYFTFDDSGTGTTSTYGDPIATKTAGDFSAGIISMIGNVAYTTEAGIYTTTLTFIATGTY